MGERSAKSADQAYTSFRLQAGDGIHVCDAAARANEARLGVQNAPGSIAAREGAVLLLGHRLNKIVHDRERLAAPFTADASDTLYQWDSSRDYNPSAELEKIAATVLAINAADDERNPLELGILDREMKRVKHGRVYVIPAGPETSGHGTTGNAKFYKRELEEVLRTAPRPSK